MNQHKPIEGQVLMLGGWDVCMYMFILSSCISFSFLAPYMQMDVCDTFIAMLWVPYMYNIRDLIKAANELGEM